MMRHSTRLPLLLLRRHQNRSAFTLAELLVVLAIVAIMAVLLFPAIQMVRKSASRSHCLNNVRQIAMAIHSYEASNGQLPPTIGVVAGETALLHWHALLLPFLEQGVLDELVREQSRNGTHVFHNPFRTINVPVLQCPSNPDLGLIIESEIVFKFAFSDYCGVAGITGVKSDGVFRANHALGDRYSSLRLAEVTDGSSNTAMFGERPPSNVGEGFGSWLGSQQSLCATIGMFETRESLDFLGYLKPGGSKDIGFGPDNRENRSNWTHHWSYHSGGANFSFVDGSAHFVSYATSRGVLWALATRQSGD